MYFPMHYLHLYSLESQKMTKSSVSLRLGVPALLSARPGSRLIPTPARSLLEHAQGAARLLIWSWPQLCRQCKSGWLTFIVGPVNQGWVQTQTSKSSSSSKGVKLNVGKGSDSSRLDSIPLQTQETPLKLLLYHCKYDNGGIFSSV